MGINTFENFIQTDASINSAIRGRLVDSAGRLIGINTATVAERRFARISLRFRRNATEVMKQLIEEGRVSRGWFAVDARWMSHWSWAPAPPEGERGRCSSARCPADLPTRADCVRRRGR
jgi:S1-C subfamily serine protease